MDKVRVYCSNCKYVNDKISLGLEPCKKHPFTRKNRDYDCPSYKKKWWLLWIKGIKG